MFQIPRPSRLTLQGAAIALIMVLVMSCVRPLGVLFLGLLSYWLYWTRCSFRVVLTPQLRSKFESWLQRAENWRRTKPSMFCLVSCSCLVSLAALGHLISGSALVLTLLVIATLISTKYDFPLLQIERKDFKWSEKITYNNAEAELDDFMPDVNESNIFVLERASDVATISSPTDGPGDDDDERSDDIPSELLLIPDVIPEIDEHSTDEDDELVPLSKVKNNLETNAAFEYQQDEKRLAEQHSAIKPDKSMEFRRGHFKRDSSLSSTSSSSDENLSKGLQFPDHTTVDGAATTSNSGNVASSLLELAVKAQSHVLLPSLITGLVQWGANDADKAALNKQPRRNVTALDSSDESDFEILETDDFK